MSEPMRFTLRTDDAGRNWEVDQSPDVLWDGDEIQVVEEGDAVPLTRNEMLHLLSRCTESTNTPKVNGYSCETCRNIGAKLKAALAAADQPKEEGR